MWKELFKVGWCIWYNVLMIECGTKEWEMAQGGGMWHNGAMQRSEKKCKEVAERGGMWHQVQMGGTMHVVRGCTEG